MYYLKIMTRILLPVCTHIIVSTPKAPVTKLQPLIKHSILPIIFSGNKNTRQYTGPRNDYYPGVKNSHLEMGYSKMGYHFLSKIFYLE